MERTGDRKEERKRGGEARETSYGGLGDKGNSGEK